MTDPRTLKLIELHEGRRTKLYKCTAGFNTIGVGHNLDANGLSHNVIDLILAEDIAAVEIALDEKLPWWRTQNSARQAALIDLTFNMGINGLLGFRNTLASWERGDYLAAAEGLQNSKWFGQVGRRGPRVVNMVAAGLWPQDVLQ